MKLKLPMREVMAIMMLIVCLVAILVLRKGCAEGIGNLFKAMEPPPTLDGGPPDAQQFH